jgi:hypothetical protein
MRRRIGVGIAVMGMVVFSGVMAGTSSSESTDHSVVDRYFRKLKRIPAQSASYERVEHLLEKLIERDPVKATRYFNIALTKLSHADVMGSEGTRLTAEMMKIVKKSGLTNSQIGKITSKMTVLYDNSCGGGSVAEPTPAA